MRAEKSHPRANAIIQRLLIVLLALSAGTSPQKLPTSGALDERFSKFDLLILQYMREKEISAATLTIRIDGQPAYSRGYGWADEARTKPITPDAKFRIASLTKPITAAAIDQLIRNKKFTPQSRVFELLDVKPLNSSKVDQRLRSITVEQLLHHQGGWDRDKSGDPTWDVAPISKSLGLNRPPNPREIVSYMMSQPLDFDPGSRRAYSNLGYMILGLLIEQYAGTDYYSFVQKSVLEPNNVRGAVAVHSLAKDCDPLEVWYQGERKVKPVVGGANGPLVPEPYGGFIIENRYAVGGWAMSSGGYAQFMETYGIYGDRYKIGASWEHNGAQPGTFTVAIWRKDGTKIVAFFNRNVLHPTIDEQLKKLADEVLPVEHQGARIK